MVICNIFSVWMTFVMWVWYYDWIYEFQSYQPYLLIDLYVTKYQWSLIYRIELNWICSFCLNICQYMTFGPPIKKDTSNLKWKNLTDLSLSLLSRFQYQITFPSQLSTTSNSSLIPDQSITPFNRSVMITFFTSWEETFLLVVKILFVNFTHLNVN